MADVPSGEGGCELVVQINLEAEMPSQDQIIILVHPSKKGANVGLPSKEGKIGTELLFPL